MNFEQELSALEGILVIDGDSFMERQSSFSKACYL